MNIFISIYFNFVFSLISFISHKLLFLLLLLLYNDCHPQHIRRQLLRWPHPNSGDQLSFHGRILDRGDRAHPSQKTRSSHRRSRCRAPPGLQLQERAPGCNSTAVRGTQMPHLPNDSRPGHPTVSGGLSIERQPFICRCEGGRGCGEARKWL